MFDGVYNLDCVSLLSDLVKKVVLEEYFGLLGYENWF